MSSAPRKTSSHKARGSGPKTPRGFKPTRKYKEHTWEQLSRQESENFPRLGTSSSLAVAAPPNLGTKPQYGVLVGKFVKPDQLSKFLTLAKAVKDHEGIYAETSSNNDGGELHQVRLGLWRQYCNIVSTTQPRDTEPEPGERNAATTAEEARSAATTEEAHDADTTADNTAAETAEDIFRQLEAYYDEVMSRGPARFLKDLDRDTFISMKFLHRPIHKAFLDNTQESASYVAQKKYLTRNGGMGTTITLSWGDGTAFHRDQHFDQHYSTLFVVGRTALFYIKSGLNRVIRVQPGFVLYFQASQLEHKLVWDPEDPKGEDDFYCAFTGFTCGAAAAVAGL